VNDLRIICTDQHIYNVARLVTDLCAAVSQGQPVNLRLENESFVSCEGASLGTLGMYDILDHVSQLWPATPDLVTLYTGNFEECHDRYRVINHPATYLVRHTIPRLRKYQCQTKSSQAKHFAVLIGRPSWGRLVLAANMYQQHKAQSIVTFHYSSAEADKAHHLELDQIMTECPDQLPLAADFLAGCPRTLDQGYLRPPITIETNSQISQLYDQFFVDIVAETYVSGLSFFPTEKTMRPLINHTPAVFFAPCGYVANLQRLGFKTWHQYWSEEYDQLEGWPRIQAILSIVNKLSQQSSQELFAMWQDMEPLLTHNRQRALAIRETEFLLDHGQK